MLKLRNDFRRAARKNSYMVDLMLEMEEIIKDANYERDDIRKADGIVKEAAKRLEHGGKIINLSSSVIGMKLEGYGFTLRLKRR